AGDSVRLDPQIRHGPDARGRGNCCGAGGRLYQCVTGQPYYRQSDMVEYDLVLMSLVIFVPAAFALLGLLFPSNWAAVVRWWELIGTAATLILSLCLLIEYYALLDSRSDRGLKSLHHPKTLLDARVDEAMRHEANDNRGAVQGFDWVASVPWIPRFDINY